MEDGVQFVGKHGKWVSVKKLKFKDAKPEDVIFFFASLSNTISKRMDHYLEEFLNVEPIVEALKEEISVKRASKKAVEEAIAAAQGKKVKEAIKKALEGVEGEKKELKALEEILKIYALRKAFELAKIPLDYGSAYENIKPSVPRGAKKGAVV